MASVPPVDVEAADNRSTDKQAEFELRILDADATLKENLNREADQRFWLRWIAVGMTIAIVAGMGILLLHVTHKLMTLKAFGASTSYVIALYVAPIVSMNALVISLLIAAFRKFHDGDGVAGTAAVAEGSKAALGFLK